LASRPRANRERTTNGRHAAAKGGAGGSGAAGTARRKNPRLISALLAQSSLTREIYFETIPAEEVIQMFEESYCSSLVNLLLDMKKSTTKRLFEIVVRYKKRAFVNVMTLYYYKDYLTNPLPLTLESDAGRHLPNHYAILGVPREAGIEDLKASHKLLVAAFSPDSFPPGERKMGEERLNEINSAFEILKNPKRRKILDDSLPNISYLYPRRDQSWFNAVTRLLS
jgi:hypothetical protein